MMGHDIKGRIYFSEQGVNAQFTGPVLETEQYLHWMKRQPWFQVQLLWFYDVFHFLHFMILLIGLEVEH